MKTIFVSSTFRDMQTERDLLSIKVVPELNLFARNFGEAFRFVDLRWGVNTSDLDSDEGGKKVLSVCLDEIDNARPYMIILIGDRYGWLPPANIMKNVTDDKLYLLDDYEKSVTELEIEYGALSNKANLSNCLFYFRENINIQDIPENMISNYVETDELTKHKLKILKQKIKNCGATVKSYACKWNKDNLQVEVSEDFCDMVKNDVLHLFSRDFELSHKMPWQEKEEQLALLIASQQLNIFSGRKDLITDLTKTITKKDNHIVFITSESGNGKTAIMSKLHYDLSKNNETLFIACGNGVKSQCIVDIMAQIVFKLEQLLDITTHFGKGSKKALIDYSNKFDEYSELYSSENEPYTKAREVKPLYFFIDAIEKLSDYDVINNFMWLPTHIVKEITFIISFPVGYKLPPVFHQQWGVQVKKIEKLNSVEIPNIIQSIMKYNNKELPAKAIDKIANMRSEMSALYLCLILDRFLMMNRADFNVIEKNGNDSDAINRHLLKLVTSSPKNIEDMMITFLNEVANLIDLELCNSVISLLATSQKGLRETDLSAIFSNMNLRWSNVDFSMFYKYMQKYLFLKNDARIDFLHEIMRKSVLLNIETELKNDDNTLPAFNNVNNKTSGLLSYYNCSKNILLHLNTLNHNDIVKLSESVRCAYVLDDIDYLLSYVSALSMNNNKKGLKLLANELREIALISCTWVNSFISCAVTHPENIKIIYFLNNEFRYTFNESMKECLIAVDCFTCLSKQLKKNFINNIEYEQLLILWQTYYNIGYLCIKTGCLNEALNAFNHSLENILKAKNYIDDKEILIKTAQTYEKLGDCNIANGENKLAINNYNQNLELRELLCKKTLTDENIQSLLAASNKTGDANYAQGYYYKALKVYEKNLKTLKEIFNATNDINAELKLSQLYRKIGDTNIKLGFLNEAQSSYSKNYQHSVYLLEKNRTPKLFRNWCLAETAIINISAQFTWGYIEDENINTTNSTLEKLSAEYSTPQELRDIAQFYEAVSDYYSNKDKPEIARNFILKSNDIYKTIFHNINTAQAERDYAFSCIKKGSREFALLTKDGAHSFMNWEYGMKASQKDGILALKSLAEKLITPETKFDLAMAYEQVGSDRALNRLWFEDALKNFNASHDICKNLSRELNTIEFITFYSLIKRRVATIFAEQKQFERALSYLNKSLKIELYLAENSDSVQPYIELSVLYLKIGEILLLLGHDDNWNECIKNHNIIINKLKDRFKDKTNFHNIGARFFKLGIKYIKQEKFFEALTYLKNSSYIFECNIVEFDKDDETNITMNNRYLLQVHEKLGEAYLLIGNYDKAIEHYTFLYGGIKSFFELNYNDNNAYQYNQNTSSIFESENCCDIYIKTYIKLIDIYKKLDNIDEVVKLSSAAVQTFVEYGYHEVAVHFYSICVDMREYVNYTDSYCHYITATVMLAESYYNLRMYDTAITLLKIGSQELIRIKESLNGDIFDKWLEHINNVYAQITKDLIDNDTQAEP